MARYIDGYVVPVPKKKINEYRRMAQRVAKIWKKYGALEYVEAVADMCDPKKLPFDAWRMFWGGFKPLVEA